MKNRKIGRAVCWPVMVLTVGAVATVNAASPLEDPRLSIGHAQTNVVVSWPGWATNWVLEQMPDLQGAAPWAPLPPAGYQTNATNIAISLLPVQGQNFFRLRKLAPAGSGMTGYWRFEEGTGGAAGDEDPNGPRVVFSNGSWVPGRVGAKALHFNGNTRAWFTNINYRVLPGAGRAFSVSLSFSVDGLTTGWRGLVGNDTGASNGWHVALQSPGPGTNYLVFASGGLKVTAQALLLPGQWYDLTVTYDGTHGSIYLDGNLLAREAGSLVTHDGPVYIGGGIAGYNGFWGRMDELRTYTAALSAEQLAIKGRWSFDESVGAIAYDSSVYGHHARLSAMSGWAPGKRGYAVNVSTNAVSIPNDYLTVLPQTGGPFSLSLWIFPHALPVGRSALLSAAEGNNSDWQLTLDVEASGQTAVSFVSLMTGGTLNLRAPIEISSGAWTKLDITYNGGIATVYVNGRKVRHDNGVVQGSRGPIMVGRGPGLGNFNGLIDELVIHRRERDASEIGPVAEIMWETVMRNSSSNIVLKGSGPAGKTLTYSILSSPAPTKGSVSHAGGSATMTYHAGGQKGPDRLVYTVSDGEFTSAPATLALSVVEPHWLSPAGGSMQPLDGSSPERAWMAGSAEALDAIWRTNNYYDCFFYAPGTYQTTGCKYLSRPTARPGCKHMGSGSTGAATTTLKLVNALESTGEEAIFATLHGFDFCDGFEVHNMVLDCNAANNPKYIRGEPVWIRVPLAGTSRVETLTLRWNTQTAPGPYQLGRAVEFKVCARVLGSNGYTTNCVSQLSTGQVDRVNVGAVTDELVVWLERRDVGVDIYSVADIEVSGNSISLPTAIGPGGTESRLDSSAEYSIIRAIDGNAGTSWVSGTETNVEILLPLDPRTAVTHLNLDWHCHAVGASLLSGPAADYHIRAREPDTGLYRDVTFTRGVRSPEGREVNTFATPIVTDRLVLVLTAREPTAHLYSLSEVTAHNNGVGVRFRLPSAIASFAGGDYTALRAFDRAPETSWASAHQGAVTAISGGGNNLKFTRLKIVGFGTKAGRECFPVFILNPVPAPALGNVLVEDCLFTDPATNNTEGVSALSVNGKEGSLTNAIVRRCTVRGLKRYFAYSHAFGATRVENCLVEDCSDGAYFEPDHSIDNIGPVLIRSNRFINVDNGVWVRFHPGRQFDSITCLNNETVLSESRGWGFGACDICIPGPSGSISNVTVLDNVIRYADWLPRPTSPYGVGLHYSDMRNAVFANNIVAVGARNAFRVRPYPAGSLPHPVEPERCDSPPLREPTSHEYPPSLDPPPAGYRLAWVNNRDLSGGLLQVWITRFGVDTLASQQQPPSQIP